MSCHQSGDVETQEALQKHAHNVFPAGVTRDNVIGGAATETCGACHTGP